MTSIRAFWRSNPLVRLFVTHAAIGFGLAALAVGAILALPTGDLGHLLRAAPLAIVLLWFFMGLTFASAQMGMAIMERGGVDESGGGGHRAPMVIAPPALLPVRDR